MTLLLDTNAFIWAISDVSKLGRKASADIANPSNHVYLADITLLECAIKKRTGKLEVDIDFKTINKAVEQAGFGSVSFDAWAAQHFVDLQALPWGDPFDAAHIALAKAKHMTLVTADINVLNVGIEGLRTMDARK